MNLHSRFLLLVSTLATSTAMPSDANKAASNELVVASEVEPDPPSFSESAVDVMFVVILAPEPALAAPSAPAATIAALAAAFADDADDCPESKSSRSLLTRCLTTVAFDVCRVAKQQSVKGVAISSSRRVSFHIS